MKLLCLHGMGTSSDIFQLQLRNLEAHLPPDWTFDYLEGDVACQIAPEVKGIFPPPYYCYYSPLSFNGIQRAIEDIEAISEEAAENGQPFDGVIGFSQGAALAASYLLRSQERGDSVFPFKFAIFLSASVPFSCSFEYGIASTSPDFYLSDLDPFLRKVIEEQPPNTPIRRWVSGLPGPRIKIPTLHVHGRRDPYMAQSMEVIKLCVNPRTIVHNEGHEVPREEYVLAKIARVLVDMEQESCITSL